MKPNDLRVSSHSLKATALARAGRYGVQPSDQAVLGRHVSATCETSAVYSRDVAIRAVAVLVEIIKAIAEGRFFPDAPRNRRVMAAL